MRRFFSAPTRSTDVALSLLVAIAWELGEHLARAIVFWPVPRGQSLVFSSLLDLRNHLLFARVTLALLPILAWLLACWRGYLRHTRSGLGSFLALTAILVAVAAIAGGADMLLVHRLWVSELADTRFTPMVHVDSLTHWQWALEAELVAAASMAFYLRRKRQ